MNFPARTRTADLLILPRLMAVGVVLATLGVIIGWQHVPGVLSATDLLAVVLFGLGAIAVGYSLQPEEH